MVIWLHANVPVSPTGAWFTKRGPVMVSHRDGSHPPLFDQHLLQQEGTGTESDVAFGSLLVGLQDLLFHKDYHILLHTNHTVSVTSNNTFRS